MFGHYASKETQRIYLLGVLAIGFFLNFAVVNSIEGFLSSSADDQSITMEQSTSNSVIEVSAEEVEQARIRAIVAMDYWETVNFPARHLAVTGSERAPASYTDEENPFYTCRVPKLSQQEGGADALAPSMIATIGVLRDNLKKFLTEQHAIQLRDAGYVQKCLSVEENQQKNEPSCREPMVDNDFRRGKKAMTAKDVADEIIKSVKGNLPMVRLYMSLMNARADTLNMHPGTWSGLNPNSPTGNGLDFKIRDDVIAKAGVGLLPIRKSLQHAKLGVYELFWAPVVGTLSDREFLEAVKHFNLDSEAYMSRYQPPEAQPGSVLLGTSTRSPKMEFFTASLGRAAEFYQTKYMVSLAKVPLFYYYRGDTYSREATANAFSLLTANLASESKKLEKINGADLDALILNIDGVAQFLGKKENQKFCNAAHVLHFNQISYIHKKGLVKGVGTALVFLGCALGTMMMGIGALPCALAGAAWGAVSLAQAAVVLNDETARNFKLARGNTNNSAELNELRKKYQSYQINLALFAVTSFSGFAGIPTAQKELARPVMDAIYRETNSKVAEIVAGQMWGLASGYVDQAFIQAFVKAYNKLEQDVADGKVNFYHEYLKIFESLKRIKKP